ncbi:RHS repeat domain-containing protein [Pseudomonas sp.]|uniref:RHS repeat domain-containing protein n=1 Tax=Pseudomonas sp. TaxID=306 RepID=UPI0027354904|nr:RHS repeat domain-containing protein [Pseudomonas sp.]MDP3817115.1 RHS repeat-associated core domain-containing protein [Pseudomonas sp.]
MNLFLQRASLLSLALAGSFAWSCAQAVERNWSYTYNSLGLIETANGPRTDVQDVTTYAYDAQGHLTTVTNALGHITQLANFDSLGNPQSLTDANGVVTELTYSPQGWLASVSTAGSTTSFEHDAVGLITKVTRGDGSWLSYSWDGARRLTAISNNLGETLEYSLDAMGNRTAQRIKDASSSLTQQQSWVYDELGRLLRSVGAAGQTSAQQYDLNDNPTVSTNPKQHSNTQAYDALDRLVANTDPLNGVTALAYDAQDNLTQVQDPRGVTTQYQYDGLGNLTRLISPDSGTTTYSHDAAGNLISQTDANGVVTTYSYDALNRLTGKQYPASPALNVQYHHDMTADGNHGIGRLTAVQDASGVLGYHYDERGNLTEQLRSVAVNGADQYDSLGYAYDGANQLSRIDYPLGLSIHYPRNAAGQVSQVQLQVGGGQPSAFASNLSYLPFGPLKSLTWANGVSLSRSFDQDYRLSEQSVAGWNSQYGYDANSNITTLNSSLLGNLNYSYDALDRLTAEQKADQQQSYSYDAVGNRTGKTVTPIVNGEAQAGTTTTYQYASTSNRLSQIDAQAVSSDAAGNLTQDRSNRELSYDEQGRLVSVSFAGSLPGILGKTAGPGKSQGKGKSAQALDAVRSRLSQKAGSSLVEFRYNALGQRTHKISAQGTTTFLYGPDGQLLGETLFSSAGQKLRSQFYIWLDSLPLGGVTVSYDAEGSIASSTPFYLHSDHLNTPRLATDHNQQSVWQWQSDAFGVGQASGSLTLNLRFPGQYFDQESGLHYNYFRDYDPETGRYVESDPIGLKGGLNTYGYVEGNPLTNTDPTGENAVYALQRSWAMGQSAGQAFNTTWQVVFGQSLGGSIYDTFNRSPVGAPAQTDDLNERVDNPSATVPWPDRNKGKWTAICKAVDQSPKSCPTASGKQVGWGYGTANDMTTARKAAEKMAKEVLGSSNVHHVSCKCTSPKGQQIPLCR